MGRTIPTGAPQVADRRLPWLDEDEPRRADQPQAEGEGAPREDDAEPLSHDIDQAGDEPIEPIIPPVPPRLGPPAAVPPRAPRRRVRAWVVVLIIVVVIALVVATVLLALLDAGDRDDPGPGRPVAILHDLSAPLGDRREATFDLVSSATTVTVRTADLGEQLYRAATPADGDSVPKVLSQGDRLSLQLVDSGRTGPSAVEVQLSSRVRWDLRLTAGATEIRVDASAGGVTAIDFAGGATSIDVTLPRPQGTLPVRMGGGASQFTVHAPPGVPAQVRISNGAGKVVLDGETHNGVSAGSTFKPDSWDQAVDRYDIEAAAGVGQLTVQAP